MPAPPANKKRNVTANSKLLLSKMKKTATKVGAAGASSKIIHPQVASQTVQFPINVIDIHEWKGRGNDITFTLKQGQTYGDVAALVTKHFGYTRPIVLKVAEGIKRNKNIIDMDSIKEGKIVQSTPHLQSVLREWESTVGDRRRERVMDVRSEILANINADTRPREQTLGLNKFWELIQRESNMHACDTEILAIIAKKLQSADWEVAEAAAKVIWKCAEHPKIYQEIAKTNVPKILLNNLMKRTKDKNNKEDGKHNMYYFYHLGAILSLASSTYIRELLTDHAPVLFELCCRGGHTETFRMASDGLCILLATSRVARKKVAGTGRIMLLAELMDSNNTYVVLSAAAAVSVFARSKVDRKLISSADVLTLFHASIQSAMWCKQELLATASVVASTYAKSKNSNPDDMASRILEYSSISLWGFAVVLARDDKTHELFEEGHEWLNDLLSLVFFDDVRVNSTVVASCSGALGVLCKDLSKEITSSVPGIIPRLLEATISNPNPKTMECCAAALSYLSMSQPKNLVTLATKDNGINRIFSLHLAATLMFTSDMHDDWETSHLKSLTKLLTCKNKDVLVFAVSTIWCLARNEKNRSTLGKLFVVNGLCKILSATSDLELKERTAGALWLLSCDRKNAVRMAMGGGIQILSSFLRFPDEKHYIPIKTLAIGILFEVQGDPDIFSLMKQIELEESCLEVLTSRYITPYLHVQLAGLIYFMSQDSDVKKRYQQLSGKFYMEEMFSDMIFRENSEVQILGVFGVTLLAMKVASKKHLGKIGVIRGLSAIFRDTENFDDQDHIKVLHAFLNLSQDSHNQKLICEGVMDKLTEFARLGFEGGLVAEFSSSILCNLSNNGDCRAEMYKVHLAECSQAVSKTLAKPLLEEQEVKLSQTQKEMLEAETVKTVRLALGKVRSRINRPVTGLWEDVPIEEEVSLLVLDTEKKNDRGGFMAQTKKMGKRESNFGFDTPTPTTKAGLSTRATFSNTKNNLNLTRPSTAPESTLNSSLTRSNKTCLSPLRSSHRVGPVGRLGSDITEKGENRWRPPIVSYEKSLDTFETTSKPKAKDGADEKESEEPKEASVLDNLVLSSNVTGAKYTVTLQPPVHYNKITFNTNRFMKTEKVRASKTPVKLVMWKKVEDSVIGHHLFDHFISESGETMFFYHTTSIVCEALEPGPYPRPVEPNTVKQVLQSSLPPPLDPLPPSGLSDIAKPYIPNLPMCPQIDRHYIPLCSLASKAAMRTMKPSLDQVKKANMFGAVPIEPIRLVAVMEKEESESEEEEVVEEVPEEVPEVVKEPWDVSKSLFNGRKSYSDSKDIYDNPKVVQRALNTDFERMLKEPRIGKLISKQDEDVKSGKQSLDTELNEIQKALGPLYKTIVNCYEFYCLIANNFTRSAFEMGENSYNRFINDCKLMDDKLTSEACQQIFIAVNVETNKGSAEGKINEDKCLMRMEFIEVIIRFAITKYKEAAGNDISDAVSMLVEKNLKINIPPIGQVDSDDFRSGRFYNEDVEIVFKKYKRVLDVLYQKYKNYKPVSGSALFSVPQWIQFLKDSLMLGDGDDGDFTAREAMLAFFNSRMVVCDEVKKRDKYISLQYVDFLEAIARVADTISVPTDQDMSAAGAINICDFKLKTKGAVSEPKNQSSLMTRRPSSEFLVASQRQLAEKLEKTICLVVGNIGLCNKGNLIYEKNQIRLVPQFITEEQLKEQL
ncbi:hypothetical protein TL16_g02072 [Triparma laevis f. inornata]|uniref:Uncharacterized protein n=1 Tax=Triparma laevis f. inornata TaxID=1714386 RepID=A0A9W7DTX9_9STRA|nr:hypothetical protein TL16_g02072 [Triparma laevis f. inornata]